MVAGSMVAVVSFCILRVVECEGSSTLGACNRYMCLSFCMIRP
jgi:hypothetical protein